MENSETTSVTTFPSQHSAIRAFAKQLEHFEMMPLFILIIHLQWKKTDLTSQQYILQQGECE